MPRKYVPWNPHFYYHVVSRGNHRDLLFATDNDFLAYEHILEQAHEKYPFSIASYCLMHNHTHLLIQSSETPLSIVMGVINKRFARYYNNRFHLTGHVFENRYFREPVIGYRSMQKVSQYIHLNPVKAGLVAKEPRYRWSSYRYFADITNEKRPSYMDVGAVLSTFPGNGGEQRKQYVQAICEKAVKVKGKELITN